LRRFNDEQGLGLKPPTFSQGFGGSPPTPTGQSIVDALYRGDALAAKKLFTDYVKALVQDVEYLTRLRHGAKQRVVTVRSSPYFPTSSSTLY
jgi:hypothetical protein